MAPLGPFEGKPKTARKVSVSVIKTFLLQRYSNLKWLLVPRFEAHESSFSTVDLIKCTSPVEIILIGSRAINKYPRRYINV